MKKGKWFFNIEIEFVCLMKQSTIKLDPHDVFLQRWNKYITRKCLLFSFLFLSEKICHHYPLSSCHQKLDFICAWQISNKEILLRLGSGVCSFTQELSTWVTGTWMGPSMNITIFKSRINHYLSFLCELSSLSPLTDHYCLKINPPPWVTVGPCSEWILFFKNVL